MSFRLRFPFAYPADNFVAKPTAEEAQIKEHRDINDAQQNFIAFERLGRIYQL
jgi:hypothetical protein